MFRETTSKFLFMISLTCIEEKPPVEDEIAQSMCHLGRDRQTEQSIIARKPAMLFLGQQQELALHGQDMAIELVCYLALAARRTD